MRVRSLGREIRQSALLSPFRGDFEKLAAEIEGRDMTFGANARGQADCRFTRAASQIQHFHSGFRLCIFDKRLGDVAPMAADFAFHFSEAISRYELPHCGLESESGRFYADFLFFHT